MMFSVTSALTGTAVFCMVTLCMLRRAGPLAVLEDWIHHLRAAWFWVTRDAAVAVWERRNRYREWLDEVRYGRR